MGDPDNFQRGWFVLYLPKKGGGGVAEDVEMAKNDLLKKIFNLLKLVGCNPVTPL